MAPWAGYVINQDAQGRTLNQTTNNDNGTRIIYVWDVLNQATWADYVINQDAQGRWLNQTTNNDNGTRIIYVWDVLNQATWADYVINQDALGRTTSQTVNNDNGTHVIYVWDVLNQATGQITSSIRTPWDAPPPRPSITTTERIPCMAGTCRTRPPGPIIGSTTTVSGVR